MPPCATAPCSSAKHGPQPVHFAACAASTAPLRLLLGEWAVERRVPAGADKRTPIVCAAASGRADNIRLLMGAIKLSASEGTSDGSGMSLGT